MPGRTEYRNVTLHQPFQRFEHYPINGGGEEEDYWEEWWVGGFTAEYEDIMRHIGVCIERGGHVAFAAREVARGVFLADVTLYHAGKGRYET